METFSVNTTSSRTPCYGCNKRTFYCHSICDDYVVYRDRLQKINKDKDGERIYVEYKCGRRTHQRKYSHNYI